MSNSLNTYNPCINPCCPLISFDNYSLSGSEMLPLPEYTGKQVGYILETTHRQTHSQQGFPVHLTCMIAVLYTI